jgi:hypothetical protein
MNKLSENGLKSENGETLEIIIVEKLLGQGII